MDEETGLNKHHRHHCRSEMRLVHQMSKQLGRDIILASTSIETPSDVVEQLKEIGQPRAADY